MPTRSHMATDSITHLQFHATNASCFRFFFPFSPPSTTTERKTFETTEQLKLIQFSRHWLCEREENIARSISARGFSVRRHNVAFRVTHSKFLANRKKIQHEAHSGEMINVIESELFIAKGVKKESRRDCAWVATTCL